MWACGCSDGSGGRKRGGLWNILEVDGSGVDGGRGVGGRNFGAVVEKRFAAAVGGEERIGIDDEDSGRISWSGSGSDCLSSSWDMMEDIDILRRFGERSSIL